MAIPFLPRRDEDSTADDGNVTSEDATTTAGEGAAVTDPEGDEPYDVANDEQPASAGISGSDVSGWSEDASVEGSDPGADPSGALVESAGQEPGPLDSGFGFGSGSPSSRSDLLDDTVLDVAEQAAEPSIGGEPTDSLGSGGQLSTGPDVDKPMANVGDRDSGLPGADRAGVLAPGGPAEPTATPTASDGSGPRETVDTQEDGSMSSGEERLDPAAQPVQVTDPAPSPPPEAVVPNLGTDHLGDLLGQRSRDVLRPGGGQQVARPARIIAMANQKGGVGKTTTAINLGAALAELGSRVLLVDMDPQGSLGVGLGADPHARQQTIYNLLLVDGTTVDEVLVRTNVENLHLLPANIDLAAAELLLVQEVAREQALRRVVEHVQYRYDFVLIDCPPSLGLLTINGLTAAEGVIVPLEAEYFALRGMSLLMQTLEKVQGRLNPQLKLEGIVATMFDGRTLHAREVLERVRSAFGDAVFKTTINKTIRFAEAPVAGEPILSYRPRSKGSDAYRDLAREVLAREPSS